MSVANPIIDYIDGATRRIFLKQGVSEFFPIEDLYHEYRDRRRLDTDGLRKWEPLIRAEGNVNKGAGNFTPRYVVLLLGTKIVPYDEGSTLYQRGEIITDDPDTDPELYDLSTLTTAKAVFIQPSEAEVILVTQESIESLVQRVVDILEGDVIPEATRFRILDKVSKAILVDKTATKNNDGLTELTE